MLKVICFIFGIVSAVHFNSPNNVRELFKMRCLCPKVSYPVPVCGADGKNYFDACYARCAGTTVAYEGYCKIH